MLDTYMLRLGLGLGRDGMELGSLLGDGDQQYLPLLACRQAATGEVMPFVGLEGRLYVSRYTVRAAICAAAVIPTLFQLAHWNSTTRARVHARAFETHVIDGVGAFCGVSRRSMYILQIAPDRRLEARVDVCSVDTAGAYSGPAAHPGSHGRRWVGNDCAWQGIAVSLCARATRHIWRYIGAS